MTHDELMKSLLLERFGKSPWWTADTTPTPADERAAHERREWVERGRMRGVA